MLTANEIRKKYLDFFASKNHAIIASDSLVPKDDPTVLFTTAGMQQFKRQFLGHIDDFTRASTSQKCLRTDDLDQVGVTAFHHTFFEMLGNFSFGDYFKAEAIEWAWEFLTKVLRIPPEKLWVSIYHEDQEAEKIWLEKIKIPKAKLVKLGDKSNFWPSNAKLNGPNGPCGPCSEIFFDYGVNPKCPKGDQCDPDCSCGRFSEVWNLVFTQFNRKDGGVLDPLPNKNIDTGMGLERLVAVMQGKNSNYDTDLFMPIRKAIQSEMTQMKITLNRREELVIADHIRAIVFAISDGVIPSNKERGSVVKRLINDSTNLVLSAGGTEASIYKLVPAVMEVFKTQYPEILPKEDELMSLIRRTEEAFIQVRNQRLPEFKVQYPLARNAQERGKLYFIYHDTYGLPIPTISTTAIDLGATPAEHEANLSYYTQFMKEQQERARMASKMMGDVFVDSDLKLDVPKTEFLGYEQLQATAKVLKILIQQNLVNEASEGDQIQIILDKTPFYAESGGQIGDTGFLTNGHSKIRIDDTKKNADVFIHSGKVVQGLIKVGDPVQAQVDETRRRSIMRHHTATHILQSALRKILGTHVQQQGSLVAEDRLRFDFTHPQAITPDQKQAIEAFVNQAIQSGDVVHKKDMPIDEAKKLGALSFFAEKYGARVRVVSIGDYSKEFCGGTHLNSTAEIERFKLTSEGAVAQGIRRIEAKTAQFATQFEQEQKMLEQEKLKREQERLLEKENAKQKFEQIKSSIDSLLENAAPMGSTKILTQEFTDVGVEELRKVVDLVKQKDKTAVMVLATKTETNAYVLIAIPEELTTKGIRADEIVKIIAPIMDGSGGGKPTLAQAGSKSNKNLNEAISKALNILKEKLTLG